MSWALKIRLPDAAFLDALLPMRGRVSHFQKYQQHVRTYTSDSQCWGRSLAYRPAWSAMAGRFKVRRQRQQRLTMASSVVTMMLLRFHSWWSRSAVSLFFFLCFSILFLYAVQSTVSYWSVDRIVCSSSKLNLKPFYTGWVCALENDMSIAEGWHDRSIQPKLHRTKVRFKPFPSVFFFASPSHPWQAETVFPVVWYNDTMLIVFMQHHKNDFQQLGTPIYGIGSDM